MKRREIASLGGVTVCKDESGYFWVFARYSGYAAPPESLLDFANTLKEAAEDELAGEQ